MPLFKYIALFFLTLSLGLLTAMNMRADQHLGFALGFLILGLVFTVVTVVNHELSSK